MNCPVCGELRQIRDDYMTEEQRDAYVQKLTGGAPLIGDRAKAKLRNTACYRFVNLLNTRLLWFPTAPIPQDWFEAVFRDL